MTVVGAGMAAAPVPAENQRPGDPGWHYTEAPRGTLAQQYAGTLRSIDGYTSDDSLVPGEQLQLHVSAAAGVSYRVEVYRLGWYGGAGARRLATTASRAGVTQPAPPAPNANGTVRAGWPVTDTITVGANWVSGYYIAQLVITAGPDSGTARWVPFVVRPTASARPRILVQVPNNNWQAYNGWGGKSLYNEKSVDSAQANRVSFDRPYWGAEWDLFDHELQTVRFLEREGYDVGYVTDRDVDANPELLLRASLVLVNGHDEYWTSRQRDALEAARDAGVNLAFIGANIGYWQVRYEDGGRTLVGYKYSAPDPIADPALRTMRFRDVGRPECRLLGVQYDESWLPDDQVVRSYAVAPGATAHPWFSGTGFTPGETVSDTIGYEWDLITPGCAHPPLTRLFSFVDTIDTPPAKNADAVMYTAASGARVFSTGSLFFARGLDGWRGYTWSVLRQPNPKLQAFMRNVLDDLTSVPPPEPLNLTPSAAFTATPVNPVVGERVTLTDASRDTDGTITARAWDTDGDGRFDDGAGTTAQVAFTTAGVHRVSLRVTDDEGATAVAVVDLTVSPIAPDVVINRTLPPLPADLGLPGELLRNIKLRSAAVRSTCRRPTRAMVRRARLGIQGCVRPR